VDWELVELLGVGGFGEVWKARNPHVDSIPPVALKFCLDPAAKDQLLRHEAAVLNQVMLQCKLPGIVPLLRTYLSADPPCLEYQYVEGGDLAGFIAQRPPESRGLPAEMATRIILRLAKIIGYTHRLDPPIVHRDLKPANILLEKSPANKLVIRIADFGIGGVAAGREIDQTKRGIPPGQLMTAVVRGAYTLLYASPQQVRGLPPDPRDDVHALGVIWYQLLMGDLGAGRPGGKGWRNRLAEKGMNAALLDLLEACFEDDPDDRPCDASVLTAELHKIVQSDAQAKENPSTPPMDVTKIPLKNSRHIDLASRVEKTLATKRVGLAPGAPCIGIDFGTSNSVVANFQYGQVEVVPNHEGLKWTPSIVTLRRDGTLAFGQEAKENFDEQRSIRSIKRILGTPERILFVGQNLRTEQIAVMLFSLLKKDAESTLNESFSKAVVTIPANSKGLARHATKLCAGAAGLQVLTLINEPTAAAICYGLNAQDDQTVLVYDFGGTLNVTVLKIHHGIFEEVASESVGKLGGDDIDALIAKVLAERFQDKTGFNILDSPYKQQFMLAVEQAKVDLSTEQTTVARKAELVPDWHLSLEEEISRGELERIIMPLIVKSGTAIDEAMKLAKLRSRDIDRVLLIGGTSKIPLVRRYVAEKLGKEPEPFGRIDPMTCVAQGAAIVSAILQGAPGLDNYAYRVKLEHSLCVPRIDPRDGRRFLDPIIKRGSDIPCWYRMIHRPESDPVSRVLISVYEGDDYDDPDSSENVKLAEIPWEFKPLRSQREATLEVMFEYGDDGILTIQIHDIYTGQKKRFAIQQGLEAHPD
jgi:molecular chaperone DnaK